PAPGADRGDDLVRNHRSARAESERGSGEQRIYGGRAANYQGLGWIGYSPRELMHRFFVAPEAIQGQSVTFPEDVAFQLGRVLRMRPGDLVVVLDNSGWEREVELVAIGRREATGVVRLRRRATGEPRTKITLYQSLLKGKKLELVFQKCTELGVVEFVPTLAARCVMDSLDNLSESKFERWRTIIREAAEQSRRGRLPELQPATLFDHALDQTRRLGGLTIIPWEG